MTPPTSTRKPATSPITLSMKYHHTKSKTQADKISTHLCITIRWSGPRVAGAAPTPPTIDLSGASDLGARWSEC